MRLQFAEDVILRLAVVDDYLDLWQAECGHLLRGNPDRLTGGETANVLHRTGRAGTTASPAGFCLRPLSRLSPLGLSSPVGRPLEAESGELSALFILGPIADHKAYMQRIALAGELLSQEAERHCDHPRAGLTAAA